MAMNGEILARMIEVGCIDEDVLELTLTEGEGNEVPVGPPVGPGGGDGGIAITEFASISAGRGNHTCGVKTDRTIACWGADYQGQATPPGSP